MEWQNGIDTVAHEATLEANGKTIAVLGNGLNNIFPSKNILLYRKIIENGGLIISEYPPDIKANSVRFLNRNRIVSGISLGILVIEAKYRSGTSVTARLAKEQRRKVFTLPHEIWDINGVGTNRLIKKGAILVTEVKDIIEQFKELEYHGNKDKEQLIEQKILKKEEIDKAIEKKDRRRINKKSKIQKIENKDYQEIYEIIGSQIYSVDEICKKTTKNIVEVNQIMLMMEIEGYIQKVRGGYKCI